MISLDPPKIHLHHIVCMIKSDKGLVIKTFDFKNKKPRQTRRLPDLAELDNAKILKKSLPPNKIAEKSHYG